MIGFFSRYVLTYLGVVITVSDDIIACVKGKYQGWIYPIAVENNPKLSYVLWGRSLAIVFISIITWDKKYVSEGTGTYT